MHVATVTVVHETERPRSKQRSSYYCTWGVTNLNTKMAVVTVTAVHHEPESILSKQRIEAITAFGEFNQTLQHPKGCC